MVKRYFEDHIDSMMSTYFQHVAMQDTAGKKKRMLAMDRVHNYLINILRGRFSVFDDKTDHARTGFSVLVGPVDKLHAVFRRKRLEI